MKLLTIIIHTDFQQILADTLRNMDQVSGFTFTRAEGHGLEVESDAYLSIRDDVVGYVPRIRTEILLDDTDVNVVLDTLRSTDSRVSGQGLYWVTAVEDGGHLR